MATATAEISTIHVRIDDDTRQRAAANAAAVGIPLSTLLRAFLVQFAAEGVVPFEIRVPGAKPNERVRCALKEADEGKVSHYKDSAEMFEKLGIKI